MLKTLIVFEGFNHSTIQIMTKKLLFISLLLFIGQGSYAQETDKYGGFTDIKGEKTGFFHAEQIDGRWWLITPDGNAFYGIGMAHPVTDLHNLQ